MFGRKVQGLVFDPQSGETGLFSIYDTVAEEFTPPFFCASDALAVRQFKRALGDDPFIGDYRLYELARYDVRRGVIRSVEHREVFIG